VIRDIAGRQNHSVKLARKLLKKKHRRERGLLVCEGMDLLVAAVEAEAQIREVLVRSDLVAELPRDLLELASSERPPDAAVSGTVLDIGVCDRETLEYASALGGAVDVIFMCAEPLWSLDDVAMAEGVTLFLDGVGDPGNVGTVIRSAVAFGLAGVICSPGTADPFGPKAMRAGMGAQFSVPVVTEVSVSDLKARLAAAAGRKESVPELWVADPHEGEDIRAAQAAGGMVVVLGTERKGPSSEWSGCRRVSIPQHSLESINVAMAGTIFAYESYRLRSGSGGK